MHRYKIIAACYFFVHLSYADDKIGAALPVYTESQLIRLFETNSHLDKVGKKDSCQLLQDIEARAIRLALPAYQFLYADMLAWGVCVEQNSEQGLYYMRLAAKQGLVAALEQLGRYYAQGIFVQQDKERAMPFLREAASLGNTKARVQFAELLLQNFGSPLDYESAYHWLYQTVTANKSTQQKITTLRKGLEMRMPEYAIEKAKKRQTYW